MIRIGAYYPEDIPRSSAVYADNILKELDKIGISIERFLCDELPARVDIIWQPSTGRNGPDAILKKAKAPVVVTFHGVANLALPLSQCFGPSPRDLWTGLRSRLSTYLGWRANGRSADAIIAVSNYAKKELSSYLGVPPEIITAIYHGVDHEIFQPAGAQAGLEPYFLHISSYQPKKNLDRTIAAYLKIPKNIRPRFIMVAPDYSLPRHDMGIELINRYIDHKQAAILYQNALGFIFPSLHETFGLPIVEAMACGSPVIASNHAGCAEIAGEAALIVDPFSIDSIHEAMDKLIHDEVLRKTLREKGIERSKLFTWQNSAEKHLAVFKSVLSG